MNSTMFKIRFVTMFMVACSISLNIFADGNRKDLFYNLSEKDTLRKIWETPADFQKPECVFYDEQNNVLYVSNISEGVAGDGFLSKITTDGKIIELKWVNGLNDPKGICIYKQKLYVADNNEVVEIDVKTGKIVEKFQATDSKALNDIAIDKDGTLYISDYKGSAIYRLTGKKMERWIDLPELQNVNGMLFENNILISGTTTNIYTVDTKTGKLAVYIERSGFVDGISPIGGSRYLVSDWKGNITLVEPKKQDVLILSTVDQKINQADFAYLKNLKMLISPTFFHNRVIAYKFGE